MRAFIGYEGMRETRDERRALCCLMGEGERKEGETVKDGTGNMDGGRDGEHGLIKGMYRTSEWSMD